MLVASKKYTVAEYLKIERRSGVKHEYYNGKLIPMAGGTISHNRISRNILIELGKALFTKPEFEIFGSDQKVYVPKFKRYLYPDVLVIAGSPVEVEGQADAIVNPLLIIEVLSNSTREYDGRLKFIEYKSLPSFKEYVLLRQDIPEASTMLQESPEVWHSYEVEGLQNELWFRTIDERIPMSAIYDKVEF